MAEATGKADAALARAERVLAQLLSLARLDAAEAAGGAVPVDVAALAREIAAISTVTRSGGVSIWVMRDLRGRWRGWNQCFWPKC